MTKKLLVPIGPSPMAEEVLKTADDWAQSKDAELILFHAALAYPALPDFDEKFETFINGRQIKSKFSVKTVVGDPGPEIVKEAKKSNVDAIVMGDNSNNIITRFFLGGVTNHVLHYASCPLYIIKKKVENLKNIIIAPTDYSGISKKTVLIADEKASHTNAELIIMHVEPQQTVYPVWYPELYGTPFRDPRYEEGLHEDSVKRLDTYVDSLNLKSNYKTLVSFGTPYEEINRYQDEVSAKLVVLGPHEGINKDRFMLGSNTNYLLNHLKCSIYIYKEDG